MLITISGLLLQTQSRSTGYISRKSKMSKLQQLIDQGLITDFNLSGIIFRFQVRQDNLKEVEQTLRLRHIEYSKERT